MGILAALHHRGRTGEGQFVDTSLLEAGVMQTYWQSAMTLATGNAPGPLGSAHPLNAPYQAFETADGWIVVGGANQRAWQRLVEALGAPELADDPRFAENRDRMRNLDALVAALQPHFAQRSSADWLARLEAAGVPAGPVNDIAQVHADPQVLARDMVVEVEHRTLGPVKTLGLPVKFSRTPGGPRFGAPVYGQHSREILEQHGFAGAEIEALIAQARWWRLDGVGGVMRRQRPSSAMASRYSSRWSKSSKRIQPSAVSASTVPSDSTRACLPRNMRSSTT
jgi:crotonobetainyl-CoA:carnitine CoA-transferase CaiB-like acyl-CoA transferase